MKVNRAKEIIQTGDRITVKLDGVPVWIDSVDSIQETARVHAENNPADVKTVAVNALQEVQ